MGYHPGLEDDAFYLAAIKRNLNPSLFPHDAEFFRLQFQATIFDKLIALSVRADSPVSGVDFTALADRGNLSAASWMLANQSPLFLPACGAVGCGHDHRRIAYAACLWHGDQSCRSVSASAHAGNRCDSRRHRCSPRSPPLDRRSALGRRIRRSCDHGQLRNFLLRVSCSGVFAEAM